MSPIRIPQGATVCPSPKETPDSGSMNIFEDPSPRKWNFSILSKSSASRPMTFGWQNCDDQTARTRFQYLLFSILISTFLHPRFSKPHFWIFKVYECVILTEDSLTLVNNNCEISEWKLCRCGIYLIHDLRLSSQNDYFFKSSASRRMTFGLTKLRRPNCEDTVSELLFFVVKHLFEPQHLLNFLKPLFEILWCVDVRLQTQSVLPI